MKQTITVRKKENVKLIAFQCEEAGTMTDDRGQKQPFVKGDWILKTSDGRQWPVDNNYFINNYEEVLE